MPELTPAQYTVLSEAKDEWTVSYANLNTVSALERRGLIESECRGRLGLNVFLRRTEAGRDALRARRYDQPSQD